MLQVTEEEVLNLLEKILTSTLSSVVTKQFTLTATAKLLTRFTSSSSQQRLRKLLSIHGGSTNLDLQQRSVEFGALVSISSGLRQGLLEPIPIPEKPSDVNRSLSVDYTGGESEQNGGHRIAPHSHTASSHSKADSQNIIDLLGMNGSDGDIFSGGLGNLAPTQHSRPTNGGNILDLFGNDEPSAPPAPKPTVPSLGSIVAFEKNGLRIELQCPVNNGMEPGVSTLLMSATNANALPIGEFVFQAAVPKSLQLQMLPPSGSVIPPANAGSITQMIKINNATRATVRLRIRIAYTIGTDHIVEQAEVANMPASWWQ